MTYLLYSIFRTVFESTVKEMHVDVANELYDAIYAEMSSVLMNIVC